MGKPRGDAQSLTGEDIAFNRRFGKRLREIVERSGSNEKRFAEEIGVSDDSLRRYMEGSSSPQAYTIQKIITKAGAINPQFFEEPAVASRVLKFYRLSVINRQGALLEILGELASGHADILHMSATAEEDGTGSVEIVVEILSSREKALAARLPRRNRDDSRAVSPSFFASERAAQPRSGSAERTRDTGRDQPPTAPPRRKIMASAPPRQRHGGAVAGTADEVVRPLPPCKSDVTLIGFRVGWNSNPGRRFLVVPSRLFPRSWVRPGQELRGVCFTKQNHRGLPTDTARNGNHRGTGLGGGDDGGCERCGLAATLRIMGLLCTHENVLAHVVGFSEGEDGVDLGRGEHS